ncbi:MAG: transketolase C-terminal domain-containing protein, partial [Myxococcota bacterium]|nr:transketolase C-terminal domain-containing protein [Myxococcota bacterium]
MTRRLMAGSEAMAEASVVAGCRFFAGYPMTPFTELLEAFASRLPEADGVSINAESELEAIGMAWGALATGARAATGSTGQGLSLMQESLSEMTRAELPLVYFNMSRGQSDYFQSTRGGGHGDYRHVVFAPIDVREGVELTQRAFFMADHWRNPVQIYGDYLLAHTREAVEVEALDFPELPAKTWAVDGSLGGSGRARNVNPLGMKKGVKGIEPEPFWKRLQAKHEAIDAEESRFEAEFVEDAETLVVAFGSVARFVRHAVRSLREEGMAVGYLRPITLWPFPSKAVREAASRVRRVAVLEQNAGQM